jgi:hypothetical protein
MINKIKLQKSQQKIIRETCILSDYIFKSFLLNRKHCHSYIAHCCSKYISSTSFQLHSRFHRMLLDAVWYLLRLESLHLPSLSLCIDRIQRVLSPVSICPRLLLPSYHFITHPFRFTASIYCKYPCLSFSPNLHFFLYKIPLRDFLNLYILYSSVFRNREMPCIPK